MKQTFLEEVVLWIEAARQIELLKKWDIPFDRFLDVAVTHELGHAFCHESDDIKAERTAQRLRDASASSAMGSLSGPHGLYFKKHHD